MRHTSRLLVVMLCLGAAFSAGWWMHVLPQVSAAAQVIIPPPPQIRPQPQGPTVFSGDDIGFRVDRQNGDVPIGRLVVRVNGQWVEAQFAPGVSRLSP